MGSIKVKRRGGNRDDSVVHIDYTREQLIQSIENTDLKLGVKVSHDFKYRFKKDPPPKK